MLRAAALCSLSSLFPALLLAQAPAIRLDLSSGGQYVTGDRVEVAVQAADDGYLLVTQVDPGGRIRVLFPLDPTDDNYIRGGRTYRILGRGDREGFLADAGGDGVVFAAITADPWQFDRYSLNGHWDVRTLNTELVSDAETELVNLANRVSRGGFDYDILPYNVVGPASYADEGMTPGIPQDVVIEQAAPATTVIVDGCMGCWGWGPGISVGLGWGWDPFWGPAWNPWWTPVAWNPWWGVPGWGGGWGGSWGGGWTGGPGWNGDRVAGWQYRQRSWDNDLSGRDVPYRDRWTRNAFNATHTVAGPMPATGVSQRVSFRDRQFTQPVGAGGLAPMEGDRQPSRRSGEATYQGTRQGITPSQPENRGRPARAPLRRDQGQGRSQEPARSDVERRRRGLEEAPLPTGDRRNTIKEPTYRRPEVLRRDTDRRPAQATPERKPASREPTLERRGSRSVDGARQGNQGSSRSAQAGRRQGGGGSPSVRSPSGSGRSGGPTPSAPRSGGQPSSRRR